MRNRKDPDSRENHKGEFVRCPITTDELRAFKVITIPGTKLKCRRPRRRNDEEHIIEKMTVLRRYPFIVVLSYMGECGKTFETSMTWAEAIIRNRKRSKSP